MESVSWHHLVCNFKTFFVLKLLQAHLGQEGEDIGEELQQVISLDTNDAKFVEVDGVPPIVTILEVVDSKCVSFTDGIKVMVGEGSHCLVVLEMVLVVNLLPSSGRD